MHAISCVPHRPSLWHTRAVSPSQRQLAHLFEQHKRQIFRRAMKLMGNASDAEDVTQEVFIKAMRGPDLVGREMVAWLYRVTTNHCLDVLRGRRRRRELMDEVVRPAARQQVDGKADEALTLRWLLSNADAKQAKIAVYIYVDGLSAAQAAELVGVSRRTAFNLLDRFRAWAKAQTASLETGP